jgi:hypothetical protein
VVILLFLAQGHTSREHISGFLPNPLPPPLLEISPLELLSNSDAKLSDVLSGMPICSPVHQFCNLPSAQPFMTL